MNSTGQPWRHRIGSATSVTCLGHRTGHNTAAQTRRTEQGSHWLLMRQGPATLKVTGPCY
ncbi:hypothetical protein [Arthrobacter polaris]|uniref:hypothetical protein n=1 Tax=Arthrobacter polaris TaxID=2813727 RepID=UPI0038990D3B|nr:hypothetical protein J0916_12065 [Arthrobacter polaris]